jgi:hypothetical protein
MTTETQLAARQRGGQGEERRADRGGQDRGAGRGRTGTGQQQRQQAGRGGAGPACNGGQRGPAPRRDGGQQQDGTGQGARGSRAREGQRGRAGSADPRQAAPADPRETRDSTRTADPHHTRLSPTLRLARAGDHEKYPLSSKISENNSVK